MGGVLIKKNSVINFEELEQWIVTFESMFGDEGLTIVEQDLVLAQLKSRLNQKVQKQKMADAVSNVPLGGLFKRAVKMSKGRDEV